MAEVCKLLSLALFNLNLSNFYPLYERYLSDECYLTVTDLYNGLQQNKIVLPTDIKLELIKLIELELYDTITYKIKLLKKSNQKIPKRQVTPKAMEEVKSSPQKLRSPFSSSVNNSISEFNFSARGPHSSRKVSKILFPESPLSSPEKTVSSPHIEQKLSSISPSLVPLQRPEDSDYNTSQISSFVPQNNHVNNVPPSPLIPPLQLMDPIEIPEIEQQRISPSQSPFSDGNIGFIDLTSDSFTHLLDEIDLTEIEDIAVANQSDGIESTNQNNVTTESEAKSEGSVLELSVEIEHAESSMETSISDIIGEEKNSCSLNQSNHSMNHENDEKVHGHEAEEIHEVEDNENISTSSKSSKSSPSSSSSSSSSLSKSVDESNELCPSTHDPVEESSHQFHQPNPQILDLHSTNQIEINSSTLIDSHVQLNVEETTPADVDNKFDDTLDESELISIDSNQSKDNIVGEINQNSSSKSEESPVNGNRENISPRENGDHDSETGEAMLIIKSNSIGNEKFVDDPLKEDGTQNETTFVSIPSQVDVNEMKEVENDKTNEEKDEIDVILDFFDDNVPQTSLIHLPKIEFSDPPVTEPMRPSLDRHYEKYESHIDTLLDNNDDEDDDDEDIDGVEDGNIQNYMGEDNAQDQEVYDENLENSEEEIELDIQYESPQSSVTQSDFDNFSLMDAPNPESQMRNTSTRLPEGEFNSPIIAGTNAPESSPLRRNTTLSSYISEENGGGNLLNINPRDLPTNERNPDTHWTVYLSEEGYYYHYNDLTEESTWNCPLGLYLDRDTRQLDFDENEIRECECIQAVRHLYEESEEIQNDPDHDHESDKTREWNQIVHNETNTHDVDNASNSTFSSIDPTSEIRNITQRITPTSRSSNFVPTANAPSSFVSTQAPLPPVQTGNVNMPTPIPTSTSTSTVPVTAIATTVAETDPSTNTSKKPSRWKQLKNAIFRK